MKYENYRDRIKTGDVLGWTHRRLRSWYDFKIMMVRLFQVSKYCHVGTAVVLGGRVWVLEAVKPHVRFVPLSNLLPCDLISQNSVVELSQEQLELGLSFVGKEDIEYSEWECVKAFFSKNDKSDTRVQCAELVCILLDLTCKATPSAVMDFQLAKDSMLVELAL